MVGDNRLEALREENSDAPDIKLSAALYHDGDCWVNPVIGYDVRFDTATEAKRAGDLVIEELQGSPQEDRIRFNKLRGVQTKGATDYKLDLVKKVLKKHSKPSDDKPKTRKPAQK